MHTKEDRLVDLLEVPDILRYAKLQRRNLGWEGLDRVDPLSLKAVTQVWTVRGITPFRLEFLDNGEWRTNGAYTEFDGTTHIVEIQESVRRAAFMGDGRARFVIAQQLGHATLRHPEMLEALYAKKRQAAHRNARVVWASGWHSAEFQAGVFAAALLIRHDIAGKTASLEELSVRAGIDMFSARYYYREALSEIAQLGHTTSDT